MSNRREIFNNGVKLIFIVEAQMTLYENQFWLYIHNTTQIFCISTK